MKLLNILFILIVIAGLTSNSAALELDEARSKKLVIEMPDGFIKANDPSAKALEADINAKRRKAYEEIANQSKAEAQKNGGKELTVEEVGKRAAEKIKNKTN